MTDTPAFVIHRHSRGEDAHLDLMLGRSEDIPLEPLARDNGDAGDSSLLTWRIDTVAEELADGEAEAVRLFDHDGKFLDYEGPVNNGAATVKMVDRGTYELASATTCRLEIHFYGQILEGRFTLTQTQGRYWKLQKVTD